MNDSRNPVWPALDGVSVLKIAAAQHFACIGWENWQHRADMKTATNPAAACGYILPEDPTAQRKLAADLGVETLISSIHPVGSSGWTLVEELEARKIVDQWAKENGRTGSHWRNTRKFALSRIRRDGLAAGRIHFGPKPE